MWQDMSLHAVTRNESGLEYAGEAGAINEALSDILGVAVEKYANNGKFNWTMGNNQVVYLEI